MCRFIIRCRFIARYRFIGRCRFIGRYKPIGRCRLIVFSVIRILNISDVSRITVNFVSYSLETAIRQLNIVFSAGSVTISWFILTKVNTWITIIYTITITVKSWVMFWFFVGRCRFVGSIFMIIGRSRFVNKCIFRFVIMCRCRLVSRCRRNFVSWYRCRLVNRCRCRLVSWCRCGLVNRCRCRLVS